MEDTINHRIRILILRLGIKKKIFASAVGYQPQTITNIINQESRKPTLKMVSEIVNKYNVNYEWLVEGKGEMFSSDHSEQKDDVKALETPVEHKREQNNTARGGLSPLSKDKDGIIEFLLKENKFLNDQNDFLKSNYEQMKKMLYGSSLTHDGISGKVKGVPFHQQEANFRLPIGTPKTSSGLYFAGKH